MWIYIGIAITTLVAFTKYAKMVIVAGRRIIIQRNSLHWLQQVFANQLSHRLVEIHHHHYVIHYPYGITWYKILLPRRIGPCMIDEITNHAGNNVKNDVFAFMGPNHDFHGTKVTPEMLGYKSLTFTYLDTTEKTFESSDIIHP